jgi:hypothetical protein
MKLLIPRVVKNWKYATEISLNNINYQENTAGSGRRFSMQDEASFWNEAFQEFNLTPDEIEPMFKNLIGNHYIDGAYVHEHTDPAPSGYVHTRCNLMIKKPNIGGNPIIDGEEFNVQVNDLWLCLASLEKHASTPILGGERLVFSFGALIKLDKVKNILHDK